MKLYKLLKVLAPKDEIIIVNGEQIVRRESFYSHVEKHEDKAWEFTRLSKIETDREVTEVASGNWTIIITTK